MSASECANHGGRHRRAAQGLPSGDPIRLLDESWERLCDMASTLRPQFTQWSDHEECLRGLDHPQAFLERIDGADNTEQDAILLALIRLAQSDHDTAGVILLQAMLPKLILMMRTAKVAEPGSHTMAERHATVITTFWLVVADYPLHCRRGVAGFLALNTLNQITQSQSAGARSQHACVEVPLDPTSSELDWPTSGDPVAGDPRFGLTNDATLDEVLTSAVDGDVIRPDAASLIARVYLPHPADAKGNSGFGTVAAARDLGLPVDTVRKRCTRARQRLIEAFGAPAELSSGTPQA